jgi:type IV pilus assembly protein PilM
LKILALDIGSYSIKALYFEKKYRGYSIINFSNTIIKRDSKVVTIDQISETIKLLITENKYQPEQVLALYSSDKTTHRFLTLPFRDNKKISATLPSELEEQLPFEIEDIIYDWEILESKGRNSNILVTATKKQEYEGFVAMLANANLTPSLVIPGADSLMHLMNYLKLGKTYVEVEKEGVLSKELKAFPVVLVDVGCSKTTVMVFRDGLPEHIRIVNYGGDYITRKVMEHYELGYEEAERSKLEVGYIIMEGDTANYTEEQIGFSNVIKEAADVIIRDVNQALSEYKSEKKENAQKCVLSGSGWKIRNFTEYMAQELRMPVEQLEYGTALGVKLPFAGTQEESVFSSLAGFFLRFINRSGLKGFNFAKNTELGIMTSEGGDYYTLFKPTVKNVAIGLVLFFVYAMTHSFILNRMQAKYKVGLETKFKMAFPDKDKKAQAALLGNMSKLSREIDTRMKVERAIIEGDTTTGPRGESALMILKDLSEAIPRGQVVDVFDVDIKGKSVKIQKVIAANGDTASNFKQYLEKSGKFEAVKQGEIKQVPGGGREFEITATHKGGK